MFTMPHDLTSGRQINTGQTQNNNNNTQVNTGIVQNNNNNNPKEPKKLPPIPVRPNQTVIAENPARKISAEAKAVQSNTIPFTPHTTANTLTSQPNILVYTPYSPTRPTINNSQNCDHSNTSSKVPERANPFQTQPIKTINLKTNDEKLEKALQEFKDKKHIVIKNYEIECKVIKNYKKSLSEEWNKTSLSKQELQRAEKQFSTTRKTINIFRKELEKFNPTDFQSYEIYVDKKFLVREEIDYVYDYTSYVDYLKGGRKDVTVPVMPKATLTAFYDSTNKKVWASTAPVLNISKTHTNPYNLTKDEFKWRFKCGGILSHDEDNGIYSSVPPGYESFAGETFVNLKDQKRNIKIRNMNEEKEFRLRLARTFTTTSETHSTKFLTNIEFRQRYGADDLICFDEDDEMYTNVPPKFKHLEGLKYVDRNSDVRILRLRTAQEEKIIKEHWAKGQSRDRGPEPALQIILDNTKIISFDEFQRRFSADDLLIIKEDNGKFTSVPPKFKYLEGIMYEEGHGELRIIRARTKQEENALSAFIEKAYVKGEFSSEEKL